MYLQQNVAQWQPAIDVGLLEQIITEYVKTAQQRLRKELEYKAKIVELDLNDRRSIQNFYSLKPNEEQVC